MARGSGEPPHKMAKLDAPPPANIIIQFQSDVGDLVGAQPPHFNSPPSPNPVLSPPARSSAAASSRMHAQRLHACQKCSLVLLPCPCAQSAKTDTCSQARHVPQRVLVSDMRTLSALWRAGPQLDLPHDATPKQLETLLNGLLVIDTHTLCALWHAGPQLDTRTTLWCC